VGRTIIFASASALAIIIAAVIGNVWIIPILNNHVFTASSARAEEANNNTNFLKEIENVPKDRYLQSNVTIDGFSLTADLALSSEQKEKGLSVKEKLKENEAMLFVFEKPGSHSFWMKDMKFPIDIIWLDSNGKIVHIEENLEPCPLVFVCPSYTPNTDSQYVLETVAGFIPRHNVSVGTDVDFELVR
jgi:uncharacterized membrane protein (UPF0127 family)